MQLIKTFLQEKFNKLVTPGINKLIRFNSNGQLESVDITEAGLRPQIYLLNNTANEFTSTPTCTYGSTTIQPDAQMDRAYIFNVPGISSSTPSRTCTIKYIISGVQHTEQVVVTEYKQYRVIVN